MSARVDSKASENGVKHGGTHASTHSFQGQYLFSKYLLKSTRSVARLKATGPCQED